MTQGFEQRELMGSLFRNQYKKKPNQPDHTGECKIGGKDYRIAAWVKESRNGSKFFSLAFTEKEEQRPRPTSAPERIADFDDDIPF